VNRQHKCGSSVQTWSLSKDKAADDEFIHLPLHTAAIVIETNVNEPQCVLGRHNIPSDGANILEHCFIKLICVW
jgi:hypothetical protein